jgi:HlyD family secretion protein
VLVNEGAVVRAGDTLAVLTTPTLRSNVEESEARAAAAGAHLRELENGARTEEIRRAEADLAGAVADAAAAAREAERLRGLAERQIVSAQQYDQAKAAAASSAAHRDALQAALTLLREGTRPERVRGARAEAAGAQAAVEGARATSRDLVLLAPVPGTITNRAVELGEMVTAGQPALTIAETVRQTVRVFVNQGALSRVQIGQFVHGKLDVYPDRDFTGRVVAISPKAEFTPRVALTDNERADLLFGVKVEFADSTGMLKAGLPITVRIDAPVPPAAKAPAKP